jgi:hypothetical protein
VYAMGPYGLRGPRSAASFYPPSGTTLDIVNTTFHCKHDVNNVAHVVISSILRSNSPNHFWEMLQSISTPSWTSEINNNAILLWLTCILLRQIELGHNNKYLLDFYGIHVPIDEDQSLVFKRCARNLRIR